MASDTSIPSEYVEHFFGACHGDSELAYFNDCGARWKRGGSGWHEQEVEPGEYDFSNWDDLTATAERERVELFPVLNYTAPWASTAPEDADEKYHYPIADDHVDDWREYVERFVERYPDLTHFEVWNEPNLRKFLRVDEDEAAYKVYVDNILRPAAEVLHEHDKKVVAPSITTEMWDWSVEENSERIDTWLSYNDAWQYVDYLSVHYIKGDTDKCEVDGAENLIPFFEYVYEEYIEPGKLEGIWNTEEGFTAVEAGDSGFVALEPWERKPYSQWVPRYTIPHLHWAIEHGWDERDQYKLFWYRMGYETYYGTLDPGNLLTEEDGDLQPSGRGETLRTLVDLFTEPDRIDTYDDEVTVGFGLFPVGADEFSLPPYEFTSYAFRFDKDIFVVTWLDLPGIDLTDPEHSTIQAVVGGLNPSVDPDVSVIDYETGGETPVNSFEWNEDNLHLKLPRTADPVLYTRISQ